MDSSSHNGSSTPKAQELVNASLDPHLIRITSGGKVRTWVEFSLKSLAENPGRPLLFHTLPPGRKTLDASVASTKEGGSVAAGDQSNVLEIDTVDADEAPEFEQLRSSPPKKRKTTPSTTMPIPRLVSVVEIIKREYLYSITPGRSATALHQYNQLECLDEEVLDGGASGDSDRTKDVVAALNGRQFLKLKRTPHMKITLCTVAIPALEGVSTYQAPSIRKLSKSAKARIKRQLKKSAEISDGPQA